MHVQAKGNAAFQAGNFDEAIEHFTEGIALAPENHVLYSNRSAAKVSMGWRCDMLLTDARALQMPQPFRTAHACTCLPWLSVCQRLFVERAPKQTQRLLGHAGQPAGLRGSAGRRRAGEGCVKLAALLSALALPAATGLAPHAGGGGTACSRLT